MHGTIAQSIVFSLLVAHGYVGTVDLSLRCSCAVEREDLSLYIYCPKTCLITVTPRSVCESNESCKSGFLVCHSNEDLPRRI
jgi:hypothetical protein